jgi:predicted nucleic acid-binding protein
VILADTSVWIDHFRRGNRPFSDILSAGMILVHPFVSGELACGNLKNRAMILSDLYALPAARVATHVETLHLVDSRRLYGRGLGWIDLHLLASALISNCKLWTLDRRLRAAAENLALV